MNDNFEYIDIILLAMIAGFIFLRLRGILGRKTGHQQKPFNPIASQVKNKNIQIALSDPMGSSLYSYIKNNKLENIGNSITEGIGTARITKNFERAIVDEAFQTNDTEALNIIYDLIEVQKIVLGGSSGINIAGAIKLAKQMGPGKTIVTILCDHGKRYASKIFNKDFLKDKNLPIPKWL